MLSPSLCLPLPLSLCLFPPLHPLHPSPKTSHLPPLSLSPSPPSINLSPLECVKEEPSSNFFSEQTSYVMQKLTRGCVLAKEEIEVEEGKIREAKWKKKRC